MPLESAEKLITDARKGGYAIGYFESWNLESLQGVIDAAEAAKAPIIIGFNGEFLCRPQRLAAERLSWYAELGKAAASSARVPCALILNECPDDAWVEEAAAAGFNIVMPSDSTASYPEYIRRVKAITTRAHRRGVWVEGEIGVLPSGNFGWIETGGSLTNPEQAADFVASTGIDLLAVSVGNVHVMVKGEQALDLPRLAEIHRRVTIPLVLHGGSGITEDSLRRAMALGVVKVNYGTYLKQGYLQALRRALATETSNPHELLGMGGLEDIMVAGRLAVRDAVLGRIEMLGVAAEPDFMDPEARSAGGQDPAFLLGLYERLVLIRQFEERVRFLFLEGAMPGTIHQCQGQEATAVGVCSALRPDDFITSTFRGHGHALAKGLTVQELLDELFGAATGCCKGKGGSMHVGNMDKGMVPGIAIVAGGIPLAAGMALAFKIQKSGQVAACFFGDGAVAEGAFHEAVNMAAIWALPVIFVCENNLYGASTGIEKVMKNPKISDRAASYGFRGETVDGNDVIAVFEAAEAAVRECRAGQGPVLLELLTYRRTGHSRRDPCHYQPKGEREAWFARDPIERFARRLLERADIAPADLDEINLRIDRQIEAAVENARRAPPPVAADLEKDILA